MKIKLTSLLVAAICVLTSFCLAGCGENKKTQVYFLNFKPESAAVYE